MAREGSGEFVTNFEEIEITIVYSKDKNKLAPLLFSFVRTDPLDTVTSYDGKNKTKIEIPCAAIVKSYMKIIYLLLDITIINSWLLYRGCNVDSKNLMECNRNAKSDQTVKTVRNGKHYRN